MSAKSEIKKIEDRIRFDPQVITVTEKYDKRGFFRVHGHEDLGLLNHDQVIEHFDPDEFDLVFIEYDDNWRGGEGV